MGKPGIQGDKLGATEELFTSWVPLGQWQLLLSTDAEGELPVVFQHSLYH